jgi:sulfite exporter TauE/SafE
MFKLWYGNSMEKLELGSMFLLGLLSTGHCLGMCGPLVLAIPTPRGSIITHLGYHLGRLITYTLIGAIIGGLGGALVGTEPNGTTTLNEVRRIEVFIMLVSALVLVTFGLMRFARLREPKWMSTASPSAIPIFSRLVQVAANSHHPLAMIPFGMLMGLLPCGILYAAFARALSAGGTLNGASMVFAFGMGTVPGLLILGGAASRISFKFRRISDLLTSSLLIVMGGWIGFKALRMLL